VLQSLGGPPLTTLASHRARTQDPELRALFLQHLRQMAVLRLELEREKVTAELLRVKVGGGLHSSSSSATITTSERHCKLFSRAGAVSPQ
jgi:hypothetical protein